MSRPFVHLHCHSEGSFLDGFATVSEIVARAVELGHGSVAVTDHGEVNQHLTLDREARRAGIKPIFGVEAYQTLAPGEKVKDNHHLILLAKNSVGLHNIWALSSLAYTQEFYYKPRVTFEMLEKYHEGVIATSACLAGCIPSYILTDVKESGRLLDKYLKIFGEDFFLEIHSNTMDKQRAVNIALYELASRRGIPTTLACDSHYIYREQSKEHDVLLAIQTNTSIYSDKAFKLPTDDFWMQDSDTVSSNLSYLPQSAVDECLDNTLLIASRCDVQIEGVASMPAPPIPREIVSEDPVTTYFQELLDIGWDKKLSHLERGSEKEKVYKDRLTEEWDLIVQKGFVKYFLVVQEYVNWAKTHDILIGPARGSAGGSLIAYLLNITEIDPIRYDLLFGRFLTPGRTEMPDIDVDFPPGDAGQTLVREHLKELYGGDNVTRIGTFTKQGVKGVVRDVGRALGLEIREVEKISYILDNIPDMHTANVEVTWTEALKCKALLGGQTIESQLAPFHKAHPDLFRLCEGLVGKIRQSSIHAAGVVISADPLPSLCPIRVRTGETSTQFEMHGVEQLGFLKVDILSIRNLYTLMIARNLVKERTGEYVDFYKFVDEYDDPAVWDLLCSGRSSGIFQIETSGLTNMAKELQPRKIEELSVLIAVFRPGITRTGMVEEYIKRKKGEAEVTYLHPKLEPILRETYGVMVYQEQIMAICRELAGYSLEEADKVRKILGKMLFDKMKEERVVFVNRSVKRGVDKDTANKIFDLMEAFGIYGFNKAHSVAYATLSYWTAWMKCYHTAEFMTALLITNESDAPRYIKECKTWGIPVLPPDVNVSKETFTISDRGIHFGLMAIKGVGTTAVHQIVAAQPFSNFEDYLAKTEGCRAVTSRVTTSLIRVGAFDAFGKGRSKLLADFEYFNTAVEVCQHRVTSEDALLEGLTGLPLDREGEMKCVAGDRDPQLASTMLDRVSRLKRPCGKRCPGYVGVMPPKSDIVEWTDQERSDQEEELLGLALSFDPLEHYEGFLSEVLTSDEELDDPVVGSVYLVGGLVSSVIKHIDRKNHNMAFIEVTFNGRVWKEVVFASLYSKYEFLLHKGAVLLTEVVWDSGWQFKRGERLDFVDGEVVSGSN